MNEHEWLYGEGNGTPLQYSCLENPMDGPSVWSVAGSSGDSETDGA